MRCATTLSTVLIYLLLTCYCWDGEIHTWEETPWGKGPCYRPRRTLTFRGNWKNMDCNVFPCSGLQQLCTHLLSNVWAHEACLPQFFWPGVLFQVCVRLFALFLLLLGVVTPACHYTIKVFWEFNKTAWPGVQAGRKRGKKTGNPILQFQKVSIVHMYIHILVVVQTLTFFNIFRSKEPIKVARCIGNIFTFIANHLFPFVSK